MGAGAGGYFHNTAGSSNLKHDPLKIGGHDADGNKTDRMLMPGLEKYQKPPNPNKPKGSENRQQTGERNRNDKGEGSEIHNRKSKKLHKNPTETKFELVPQDVGRGIFTPNPNVPGYDVYQGIKLLPTLLPAMWWKMYSRRLGL